MTMYDDDEDDVLHLKMETSVCFIRVIEGEFLPSWADITTDLIVNTDYDASEIDNAVMKISMWLDIVSKCIIVSCDDPAAVNFGATITKNPIMVTPGAPTDELLATLLKAKINALGNDIVGVSLLEFKSDDSAGITYIVHGRNPTSLPAMSAWVGERNYFKSPWWHRDDGTTLDSMLADEVDETVPPQWYFRMEDLMGTEKPSQKAANKRPSGDFKPTIIPGGKK